jgi:hypothetical protein
MAHEPGHCCGCERPCDLETSGRVEDSAEAETLGAVAAGPWHGVCLAVFLVGRRWLEKRRDA